MLISPRFCGSGTVSSSPHGPLPGRGSRLPQGGQGGCRASYGPVRGATLVTSVSSLGEAATSPAHACGEGRESPPRGGRRICRRALPGPGHLPRGLFCSIRGSYRHCTGLALSSSTVDRSSLASRSLRPTRGHGFLSLFTCESQRSQHVWRQMGWWP